jgi:TPR repeat protein/AcrR family transcriptional regulator
MSERAADNVETQARMRERNPARAAILDAARRVANREGIDGTSLGLVADEAGVARAAVYAQFRSKNDLFLSIVADDLNLLAQTMREAQGLPPYKPATPSKIVRFDSAQMEAFRNERGMQDGADLAEEAEPAEMSAPEITEPANEEGGEAQFAPLVSGMVKIAPRDHKPAAAAEQNSQFGTRAASPAGDTEAHAMDNEDELSSESAALEGVRPLEKRLPTKNERIRLIGKRSVATPELKETLKKLAPAHSPESDAASDTISRLQDTVTKFEGGMADKLERRIQVIERVIAGLEQRHDKADQMNAQAAGTVHDALNKVVGRIDDSEKRLRDSLVKMMAEVRDAAQRVDMLEFGKQTAPAHAPEHRTDFGASVGQFAPAEDKAEKILARDLKDKNEDKAPKIESRGLRDPRDETRAPKSEVRDLRDLRGDVGGNNEVFGDLRIQHDDADETNEVRDLKDQHDDEAETDGVSHLRDHQDNADETTHERAEEAQGEMLEPEPRKSYLYSARRSAQSAAMLAEGVVAAETKRKTKRTKMLLAGVGALAVTLVIAGVALKRVSSSPVAAASLPMPAMATTHKHVAHMPKHLMFASVQGQVKPASSISSVSSAPLDKLSALANAGKPDAQLMIGLKYLSGDGVAKNDAEASKWIARSATQGNAVAQYWLGSLYQHGRGVAADPAQALAWYDKAAAQGNRKAMHNLAIAYADGHGVAKDFMIAARWFTQAAQLGYVDSQFNLAVLYERGDGVPQSLLDAYKWYSIAAAQGDQESKARIDAIATQLSADDLAAAQKAAQSFKPASMQSAANDIPKEALIIAQ